MIDASGDIRWYLDPRTLWKPESMDSAGVMMGFCQNPDGTMTWGFGQRYVRFDLMGRDIFNRRLPAGYNDFSHAMDPMPNGHYLLRVASSDLRRATANASVQSVTSSLKWIRQGSWWTNGVFLTYSTPTALPS